MKQKIEDEQGRAGLMSRREFIKRLAFVTGSMAATVATMGLVGCSVDEKQDYIFLSDERSVHPIQQSTIQMAETFSNVQLTQNYAHVYPVRADGYFFLSGNRPISRHSGSIITSWSTLISPEKIPVKTGDTIIIYTPADCQYIEYTLVFTLNQ